MEARILLVDDEIAITTELGPLLEHSGFAVTLAHDGLEALRKIAACKPDLIVLDMLMPGLDGRQVCRRLRAGGDWTPVIMLTQVSTRAERIMSLEEGADDYLNKPFDPLELVARIKAILRRGRTGIQSLAAARRLSSGPLTLDRPSRRVFLGGNELALTAKAFATLEYLMLHHGEVISRNRLLDEIWGWDYPTGTRAVDVRIAELRKVLSDDADEPHFIETVVSEGYYFIERVEVSG